MQQEIHVLLIPVGVVVASAITYRKARLRDRENLLFRDGVERLVSSLKPSCVVYLKGLYEVQAVLYKS